MKLTVVETTDRSWSVARLDSLLGRDQRGSPAFRCEISTSPAPYHTGVRIIISHTDGNPEDGSLQRPGSDNGAS
jgi:hypothetical protein